VCKFDGDTNYRTTYLGRQGDAGQLRVVRPSQSLQLMKSNVPFDGRTNYRDEFTGHVEEPAAGAVPDATAQPEDALAGLVLQS